LVNVVDELKEEDNKKGYDHNTFQGFFEPDCSIKDEIHDKFER
jgi:hypothetical protein